MKTFKTFNPENIHCYPVYIEMHKKSKYDIKEYALGNYPINEKFQIYFPFDGVYEVIIKPILNESADIPVLKPITTEVKKCGL